ncbi:DUF6660 family protein [Chitinophaga defluvii]|uniref:DUF6660 family protein n=1 Tax=Chitinophaga defluvii TaxID=3163343 RepID=A0ABV2TEI6_9BACT
MKWFALTLVFYLSALLLVPCSDAINRCERGTPTSQRESHNHSQDKNDNCTPFCHCNCCSVSMATYNFNLPELNIPLPAFSGQKVALRDFHFTSRYVGNIWQPPRIVA